MDSSKVTAPVAPKTRVFWPHIALGIIGLLLSIYAVHTHVRIEAGQATGCSINDTISCDDVIGSKWGKFAGIPLGYFGGAYWIIVIVTAISSAQTSLQSARLQALGVATIGLITSLALAYIAEFILHKICPICSSTHLTALINFIYAAWAWIAFRRKRSNQTL